MVLEKKLFRKGLLLWASGVVLLILVIGFVLHAGSFLVKETAPQSKADVAVILMGSIADRVLEAADVYHAAKAERLVIVNNIQYGSEALEPYGVSIPNFARLTVSALQQLGVPDSVILHLPGRAASTRDEADTIAAWLARNPRISTIALISSAAHTRRAAMIFSDSFSDHHMKVKVLTIPSKYSEFNDKRWWLHRESAKQVFFEWVKIASFVAVEQWL